MSDPDHLQTLFDEIAGETDVLTEQPHDSLDEQRQGDNERFTGDDTSVDVEDGLADAVSGAEAETKDDV